MEFANHPWQRGNRERAVGWTLHLNGACDRTAVSRSSRSCGRQGTNEFMIVLQTKMVSTTGYRDATPTLVPSNEAVLHHTAVSPQKLPPGLVSQVFASQDYLLSADQTLFVRCREPANSSY